MIVGSKVRPVYRADNLTAICEPILNISQAYRNRTAFIKPEVSAGAS
jgi:hypothetical protein